MEVKRSSVKGLTLGKTRVTPDRVHGAMLSITRTPGMGLAPP